ncbi:MAG: hypothetical protein WD069_14735 [Planctomycetales bacterium]
MSSRNRWMRPLWAAASLLVLASPVLAEEAAEDAFYALRPNQLQIIEGKLPEPFHVAADRWSHPWTRTYAVLDGEGEIYISASLGGWASVPHWEQQAWELRQIDRGEPAPAPAPADGDADGPRDPAPRSVPPIVIRAPAEKDVVGTLYIPTREPAGMTKVRFTVPAQKTGQKTAPLVRRQFHQMKEAHYAALLEQASPGAAWFRHEQRAARAALEGKSLEAVLGLTAANTGTPRTSDHFEATFQLLSGGRAVSENLQLDRLLPETAADHPTVELASLQGITVREFDWASRLKGKEPELDPLAKVVPHDQYALFFPTFNAMVKLIDEADAGGTPVLNLVQSRVEDARVKERYQEQLCLSVSAISRLLGNQVVQSVAVTGSDPYLRTGTDLAVLFEPKTPRPLMEYIVARQQAAAQKHRQAQRVQGEIAGVAYQGVASADRSVSSYVFELPGCIAVTNSLAQMHSIVTASQTEANSLAKLPEYHFFRTRYPRDRKDETGFLVITDAAIRKWCGPKWRIATSRRTRAAAVLAQLQAAHLDELVRGKPDRQLLDTKLHVPDLGSVHLAPAGVTSATYNTLEFLTPISELEFTRVTPAEAQTYERWRRGYQQNWSNYFDPIAVSIDARPDRLAADVTVMPLIDNTDYRWLVDIAGGSKIGVRSGDRHAGSLVHAVLAIDRKSPMVNWVGDMVKGNLSDVKINPLSWLGDSVSIYLDDSPFWKEEADAEDKRRFLEDNVHRIPIALRAEVSDSLKLAVFLAGVRTTVMQSAPNLTRWETIEHGDFSYVKISSAGEVRDPLFGARNWAIYYAPTPASLVVTLDEELLKRSLDREAERRKQAQAGPVAAAAQPDASEPPAEPRAWLGDSVGVTFDRKFIELTGPLEGNTYRREMQNRSWANLAILNEWKRRYPQQDPLAVHLRFWQTKLTCPGGGSYIWNEEFRTMESTAFGHPGAPQPGPGLPQLLRDVESFDFGLTFEEGGLRARAAMRRSGN